MSSRQKVSIPGKIIDLLWNDEQFYAFVEKDKRVNISRFPRFDQWCEEENLCMAFALAGFSPEDISVVTKEDRLLIKSVKEPDKDKSLQQGMIVRGIAKRKFDVSYIINKDYNLKECKAFMKNGLLHIKIPKKKDSQETLVKISEEE